MGGGAGGEIYLSTFLFFGAGAWCDEDDEDDADADADFEVDALGATGGLVITKIQLNQLQKASMCELNDQAYVY